MKSVAKLAVLLLTTTAAVPAWAQDKSAEASATEVDAIVVTGMRESLKTSVARKKNTMEIVDSITAEDIGKLPDPNVAETLTRIPGVQGYRYGGEGASPVGEGSGITIRGLTGQTASRLDGRAYFTAGGREFNIEGAIPGMIAGIDVYKNPSAEHIEGGIGGLINVRTRKPLDFGGLTISAAASMRYNDLSKTTSPEVFGLIADRWQAGDGEMGFMIAANYQESDNRSDSNPGNRGPQTRRAIRADSADFLAAGGDARYAGRTDIWHLANANYTDFPESERADLVAATGLGSHVFQEDIHRVRKGLSGAFQWKPSPDLEFYAQGNYNYYLYDQSYRFAIMGDSRTVQNLVTSDFTLDENLLNRNLNGGAVELVSGKRIDSGTFLGSRVNALLGGREERPYETWLAAVGTNWQATDKLHVHLDVSYIKADQSRLNHNVSFAPNSAADPAPSWDFARDLTTTPYSIGISGSSLTDPNNFVFDRYNTDANNVIDDNGWAGQLDLVYDVGSSFLTAIKAGGRFAVQTSRFFDYRDGGRSLGGVPLTDAQDLTELSPTNWLDGKAGYSGGYIVFDPDAHFGDNVRNRFPDAGIPAADSMPENLLARRYSREKSYAGYVVGEFAYDDFIKGNFGARIVKTDLFARAMVDSNGTAPGGAIVPNTDSASYTDVLPSFNITGYLTPDTLLRFGYAKGITRPSLGDLNPAITFDPARGGASAGNPDLKPLKADSFDVSLEHYFSPLSYVSAGIFYKKINGFPFGRQACATIPLAPVPTETECDDPAQYTLTIRDNAEKGNARGIELAGQTFFDFLPGAFKNFGVAGSFTYLKTKNPVPMSGETVDTPMPFQSKINWSASGMYEDDFMSARVVYTYRSDFVLFGIDSWPIWGRYVKGYGILDAAVNFNLPHNFTLSFTASNITNQGPNRYVGEPGAFATDFQNQHYVNGRVFGAGIRYKFGG
ncbi:TonB-dependent receptor [Novosphingobium endophyticum]|uniref:TonB-dependent receptor n=1 Tax=Novosphingobium endophyticum TaxID=1955250 RepID=A0A916TW91_9SPHN|nr:TonB-dependent receptor [Novosphingobium endophyticum]GGC14502.1 TonB-dependent receptor [Novosphingobium endophyticum]